MLKKVLLGVAAVVVLFLVFVATRPSTFHVERSMMMAAPPAIAFAEVNDLKRWNAWSPWDKKDAAMQKGFEGPESGVGAVSSWSGNGEVGKGKMTITESVAAERVAMKLEFMEPMESTATNAFTFKAMDNGTHVTWFMDGTNNFVGKLACTFMDMDAMVGADFEAGLTSLKTIAETKAKEMAAAQAQAPAPEAAAPTKAQ
jgi:hypothetical protein